MFHKKLFATVGLIAVLTSIAVITANAEGSLIPVNTDSLAEAESTDSVDTEEPDTITEKTKLPAAGVAATLKDGDDFEVVKENIKEAASQDAKDAVSEVKFENIIVKVSDSMEEVIAESEKNDDENKEAEEDQNTDEQNMGPSGIPSADLAAGQDTPEPMNPDSICIAGDYVHLRKEASEFSETTGVFFRDAVAEILSEDGEWYEVKSGNVVGYVRKSLLVTGEEAMEKLPDSTITTATVETNNLVVRKGPSKDSASLQILPEKEELNVLEVRGDWAKVEIDDGYGYIYKPYTNVTTEYITALTADEITQQEKDALREEMEEKARLNVAYNAANGLPSHFVSKDDSNKKGQEVADFAVQFVGNPYVWGGTSLTEGCDCSGFVMSVYEEFGFSLTHSTDIDQTEGVAVENIESAEAGDIICYQGHVAIYIGDGMIVHAAGEAKGIRIAPACYTDIITIRRMFTE